MQLARVVVSWQGPSVKGLAVNVLHFAADQSGPDSSAIAAAYTAFAGVLPAGVSVQVPSTGDIIEDTTGELVDVWSSPLPSPVGATGNSEATAGVGMCVTWKTGGIINGRRLRGRTFLVPVFNGRFSNDGTPDATLLAATDSFAQAMMASGPLAVWHRPTAPGAADGNSYGVISYSYKDRGSFLTSRRE